MTTVVSEIDPKQVSHRVLELDGLRGIAVLMVVFYHYVVQHLEAEPGSVIGYTGKYMSLLGIWGVDIFFVLSGFLVIGGLIKNRHSRNYFSVFYLRRSLRIFPLYYFFLCLTALVFFVCRRWDLSSGDWLLSREFPLWIYFAYIQNFWVASSGEFGATVLAATWTLAVEEQFYVVSPLIVKLTPKRFFGAMLFLVILVVPFVRVWLFSSGSNGWLASYVLLWARCDAFAYGAMVAIACESASWHRWCTKLRFRVVTVTAILCLIVAFMPIARVRQDSFWMSAVGYSINSVAASLLVLVLVLNLNCRLSRFFRYRWFIIAGRLSYCIYLFHFMVLGICFMLFGDGHPTFSTFRGVATTILSFVITLGIAYATWFAFEKKLVSFGQTVRYVSY